MEDIHVVKLTMEYLNTLHPSALRSHGFGCIDVLSLLTRVDVQGAEDASFSSTLVSLASV